ncbi:MAG: hypothetical protein ACTSVW_02495 [Candidatus Njordarchaeales archaeon]
MGISSNNQKYLNLLIVLVILLVPINGAINGRILNPSPIKSAPPASSISFGIYTGGSPTFSKTQLSLFINIITERFTRVTELTSITQYVQIADLDVLILIGQTYVNNDTWKLIETFLLEGGSVILGIPFENISTYGYFLDLFGLDVIGPILDNSSNFGNDSQILLVQNTWIKNHPIFAYYDFRKISIPNSGAFVKSERNATISVKFVDYSLIWGLNSTFVDENNNQTRDPNELYGRNVSLCHLIELWTGGKVFLLGSDLAFTNQYLSNSEFDNILLFRGLINWIGKQTAYINIGDLKATPSTVYINIQPAVLNVSFVADVSDDSVLNETIFTVVLARGSIIILKENASRVNDTNAYFLQIDVSNLSKGLTNVYVVAYKKYFGFFWSDQEVTVILIPKNVESVYSFIVSIIGLGIPGLLLIGLIVALFPYYKKNKELISKTVEKIKKE